MTEEGGRLNRAAHGLENRFDRLKNWIGNRIGPDDQSAIHPYLGFGDTRRLFIHGRVLEGYEHKPAGEHDRAWRNLWQTYRRMESDEVPGARLIAHLSGEPRPATADDEGYFQFWMDNIAEGFDLELDGVHWRQVPLQLLEPDPPGEAAQATALVQIPLAGAAFGVISDLDDTVLLSHVTQRLRMARTIFLSNARTRRMFPGVAPFYQALRAGVDGRQNPLFYVSSSPWNFYDLFMEFFELNDIPVAPLFLRDWGVRDSELLPTRHGMHKWAVIERLMTFYERLPFILIGDDGHEDPEIYLRVARTFRGRIPAVYIRDVARKRGRREEVSELAGAFAEIDSELVLTGNTVTMAGHALSRGWIAPAGLNNVAAVQEKA